MKKRHIAPVSPFFLESDVDEITANIRQVLSGKLTLGPFVIAFERECREILGVKHALALQSCTGALEAVLRYYRLEGREVIVPTETFIASANAVELAGGTVAFADIDADTLCLSLETIREKVTSKTAGVILVHLYGYLSPEIPAIREYCRERGLFLIEDSAHALGAERDGSMAGAMGDAGCFSFYSSKVVPIGEGGLVATESDEMADFVASYRHHGIVHGDGSFARLGTNLRMDELRAVVGLNQIRKAKWFVERRNEIAKAYHEGLETNEHLDLFDPPDGLSHNYWKFPLKVRCEERRNQIATLLAEDYGISVAWSYDPLCHEEPYYASKYGHRSGDFPSAESVIKRLICLPVHCNLTDADTRYIVDALNEATRRSSA